MNASRLDKETRDPDGNIWWTFVVYDSDSEDSDADSSGDELEEHRAVRSSVRQGSECLSVSVDTGTMPTLECPFTDCKEQVTNTDKEMAIAIFNAHVSTHTANANRNRAGVPSKSDKLTRPTATQGMLVESWNSFQVLWKLYKTGAGLSEAECGLQLIYCCDEELREQLLRADPDVVAKPENEQLDSMRPWA